MNYSYENNKVDLVAFFGNSKSLGSYQTLSVCVDDL